MLSDDELVAIEARAAAATPGPWQWFNPLWPDSEADLHSQVPVPDWASTNPQEDITYPSIIITDSGFYPPHGPDREFIAAVRTDIPALLAEIRRLRAQRDHARTAAERCFLAWDDLATYEEGGAGIHWPKLAADCDDGWDVTALVPEWGEAR